MSKFKFPRRPGLKAENPFQDASGKNPFADVEPTSDQPNTEAPSAASPYAASGHKARVQPYQPDDYETLLPHRANLIFRLGAIGAALQPLAILAAAAAILIVGELLEGYVYGLPGQLLGLAFSIPAWIMGQGDMNAMKARAMNDSGMNRTRLGLYLAIAGTLLGVAQLLGFVGLVIVDAVYG